MCKDWRHLDDVLKKSTSPKSRTGGKAAVTNFSKRETASISKKKKKELRLHTEFRDKIIYMCYKQKLLISYKTQILIV